MNEHYPDGFLCYDLCHMKVSDISWIDAVALNRPLLIHLDTSMMQELITSLIDAGASAATPCSNIETPRISGTLGEIATKVRASAAIELHLVVTV